MRAVRFHGRRDIRVDQIDEPVCREDQVKVRSSFNDHRHTTSISLLTIHRSALLSRGYAGVVRTLTPEPFLHCPELELR